MTDAAPSRADATTYLLRRLDRDSVRMSDATPWKERRTEKVRDWLLAILRFAVTLSDADRSAVLTIAEGIDKLGKRLDDRSAYQFFRKTSAELCSAILDKQNSKVSVVLRLHLNRIDDCRLRRAFEAVIELGDTTQIIKSASKTRTQPSQDLWKGLRSSRDG